MLLSGYRAPEVSTWIKHDDIKKGRKRKFHGNSNDSSTIEVVSFYVKNYTIFCFNGSQFSSWVLKMPSVLDSMKPLQNVHPKKDKVIVQCRQIVESMCQSFLTKFYKPGYS